MRWPRTDRQPPTSRVVDGPRRLEVAGSGQARFDRLRLEASTGAPLSGLDTLPDRARRGLGLADRLGAPMLPALDAVADAQDDEVRCERALGVATAQARAVATGLLAAPFVLVPALGTLLGAEPLAFYASGPGAAIGVAGLLALLAGAATIVALIRRVGRTARHHVPPWGTTERVLLAAVAVAGWVLGGLVLALGVVVVTVALRRHRVRRPIPPGVDEAADLLAIAVSAGVGLPQALRAVADELPHLASRLRRFATALELGMPVALAAPADAADDPFRRFAELVHAAGSNGAPIGAVLTRLAADLRADELAHVLAAVERLPAALTFPTTLCLLPATVLLIGAPIVHAGLVGLGT